ncbi:MAG: toll/interleukin-1 receptor domain-containing protein, partial [Rhodoplanes sp.]
MPRLFISHSGVDNVAALAFQRWLIANGWSEEDVFIDLHGIGAGERWRDTLRKANASCEAVILLASPDSLDSK